MMEQPEGHRQIRAYASKAFDAARTATAGVSKAASLWAAALMIAWVSGLEPMRQNVVTTVRAFEKINLSRQEAERWAVIRLRHVVGEEEEIERLKEFEQKYPAEEKRDEEYNRLKETLNEAKIVKSTLPPQDSEACENSEPCRKAKAAESKAENEMRKFQDSVNKLKSLPLAAREKRLATERKKLEEEEPKRLKSIYAEAKKQAQSQERNVSFELLGLNFKAPPLFAPLLWCLFCVALLVYLARARASSIAYCAQGFRALAQLRGSTGDELADLAERLPTWAIGPALSAYAAALGRDRTPTLLAREPWVNRVFGSPMERQFVATLVLLIPLLAWVIELRVAWIALEFSHYLGMTRVRALLPLALLSILGMTAWISGWWFFGERVIPSLDQTRRHWLVGPSAVVLVMATVFSWHPRAGIHFGFLLQQSLLWVAPISIGLLTVVAVLRMHDAKSTASRKFLSLGRVYTRREAMIAVRGIAALVVLATLLPALRFVARSRKDRKPGPPRLSLEQGFYRRPRNNGNKAEDGGTTYSSLILHYIGSNGRFSRRGSLPSLESLEKVREPGLGFYGLVDALDQDDQATLPAAPSLTPSEIESNVISSSATGAVASLVTAISYSAAKPKLCIPRVNLATASWSFEEAALEILRKGSVRRKGSEEVCQLLLCGIQHDLLFKQRINKERKKGRPSFRLYDLLAGVSVRYRQAQYFEQLLELIERSKQQLIFQTRIEKWQDVTSPWRQKWLNRRAPVTWKGNSGAVVF